jgi:MoaA/NifB/PqqE/SkfB family radical SAM enzyme
MSLSADFVEALFAYLQGRAEGLIVTGGEPTLSPAFAHVLRMAQRDYGFRDIAVVTNGTCLDNNEVASALVSHASAVRVSLYDWSVASFKGLEPTLGRIERLRKRVNESGSALEIGVSALTSDGNADALVQLAELARSAGAHWIYFHPTCTKDTLGGAFQATQHHVIAALKGMREAQEETFDIFFLEERYRSNRAAFEGYHAAHFVLVIGADGKNYLASEVKYQPRYALSDAVTTWRDDVLWNRERVERIRSVTSRDYPARGSRNRGVLYNTVIEKLKRVTVAPDDECWEVPGNGFHLPHIL